MPVKQNLGKEASRCYLRSFAADTLVLMADGTQKPIGDVEIGDHVQATDPDTGKTTVQTVEHVWVHDDALYRLHLDNGETIGVTEDHPIYNKSAREWQDTEDLPAGESLFALRDDDLRVEGLGSEPFAVDPAYNLTITGPHTYHVGISAILVHNCNPGNKIPDGIIYRRTDGNGGKPYIGLSKDAKRYAARQQEHRRANPDADFDFKIIDRGQPGTALRRLEEYWIRREGGPTNFGNPNGGLANRRHEMSDSNFWGTGPFLR